MAALDLSQPSYQGAFYHAKEAAFASMRAGRRDKLDASDKAAGDAVMVSLLWLVDGQDGGFIGLDDQQFEARCARYRLDEAAAAAAMWAPGEWPTANHQPRIAA